MRVRSYIDMLSEYGFEELSKDDVRDRLQLFSTHPYSVIVEAEHMELDGLNDWIETNLGKDLVNWLHYGKTGYDFGFAEYFFVQENHAREVTGIVPRIYTMYPHSLTPDTGIRSVGYNDDMKCNSGDEEAILFRPKG